MTDVTYAQVWADHAVRVGEPGETVTVTVLSGDTVYYGDPNVSSTTNFGSLTVGQSATIVNPVEWLLSASQSFVQITGTPTSSGGGGGVAISLQTVTGTATLTASGAAKQIVLLDPTSATFNLTIPDSAAFAAAGGQVLTLTAVNTNSNAVDILTQGGQTIDFHSSGFITVGNVVSGQLYSSIDIYPTGGNWKSLST